MKNTFLILLTVFITGTIFSQTSFMVVNEDKMPVDGAHIFRNQKFIGYTSKDGKFSMPNMPLGDTVFFKFKDVAAIHVVSENTAKVTQLIKLYSDIVPVGATVVNDFDSPFYNSTMGVKTEAVVEEDEIYLDTEESAEFPGGRSEMFTYLAKNLRYPENAIKNELQGKCYFRFVVEKNGKISNIRLTRGIPNCPECEEEGNRLVRSFPNFIPAKINGEAVRSDYELPITFKLD